MAGNRPSLECRADDDCPCRKGPGIPHRLCHRPLIEFPAALRKGPPPPDDIHLQEDRRLFFVALTRSQERLYISSVARSERQQSRFVNDLVSDAVLATHDLEIIEA